MKIYATRWPSGEFSEWCSHRNDWSTHWAIIEPIEFLPDEIKSMPLKNLKGKLIGNLDPLGRKDNEGKK